MIKILVNAPKGGVGKTTLATNIALYLAKKGLRVWALDLAQGEQMSKCLSASEFNVPTNKIESDELGSLPKVLSGARSFDFLVADTDDYYQILVDLANINKAEKWVCIVPIVNEYNGLCRIPEEVSSVMLKRLLNGEEPLNLKIVGNKIVHASDIDCIKNALTNRGIGALFSETYISHSNANPPMYIEDKMFFYQIENLLKEIEVI